MQCCGISSFPKKILIFIGFDKNSLSVMEIKPEAGKRSKTPYQVSYRNLLHYQFCIILLYVYTYIRQTMHSETFRICLLFWLFLLSSQKQMPNYIGAGYDLTKGSPLSGHIDPGFRHPIFLFNYSLGLTTDDKQFDIPNQVSTRSKAACSYQAYAQEYRGTSTYQDRLNVYAQVHGGYKAFFGAARWSFSLSTEMKRMSNQTISHSNTVTQTSATCQSYQQSLNIFKLNDFHPNFVEAVKQAYKMNKWDRFIAQFGTHFVYTVTLGGRATQQIIFTDQSVSKLRSLNISVRAAAEARFLKYYVGSRTLVETQKAEASYAEQFAREKNEYWIGGRPPQDGDAQKWMINVIENPMPIKYSLMDIPYLFWYIKDIDPQKAQDQFNEALNKYCQNNDCRGAVGDKPLPKDATFIKSLTKSYGTTAGSPFDFSTSRPITMELKKIIAFNNVHLPGIQFMFSDGVRAQYSGFYGSQIGTRTQWTVPDGEYITQVQVAWAHVIYSLTFITNKGTKSIRFGASGGNYEIITLPEDYRIVGAFGRSDNYLRHIGFNIGKAVF